MNHKSWIRHVSWSARQDETDLNPTLRKPDLNQAGMWRNPAASDGDNQTCFSSPGWRTLWKPQRSRDPEPPPGTHCCCLCSPVILESRGTHRRVSPGRNTCGELKKTMTMNDDEGKWSGVSDMWSGSVWGASGVLQVKRTHQVSV